MKKVVILTLLVICFIACGKKDPEYPIFTHDEKVAIYKEAMDNNNTEKLKEIENLMKQLEIEERKGDKIAEKERVDWHTVRVFYIPPTQPYEKPDLLNGKW